MIQCKFLDTLENGNIQVNIKSIKQLCRDSAPLIYLFQYKEDYKQQRIKKLLDEDLQQVLKGKKLKHKRSTPPFEVPQSNESLAQNSSTLFGKIDFLDKPSNSTPPSYPYRAKRGFTAFIPALAGLATIAVENIGSFLQKKHNAALIKGLNAIKTDQSLTSNSIKQLEDDLLMYGKYNLDSMEKIIHTINHLGDIVHHMETLLLGKNYSVAMQQVLHHSHLGRLLFAHKLSIYLTSVQETQLRLYDELERVLREFLSAVETLEQGLFTSLPISTFHPAQDNF